MKLTDFLKIAQVAIEVIPDNFELSHLDLDTIVQELECFENGGSLTLSTNLVDKLNHLPVDVLITPNNGQVGIHPQGYNDLFGCEPILVEYYDDQCKVSIWDDQHEDPAHSILVTPSEKPDPVPVLSEELKEWDVDVCRVGYGHHTIRVKACTEAEAEGLAIDEAGNHEYSENEAEYSAQGVSEV